MLTLLPLSGIQDALKKRNNKTLHQFGDRRGSIAVYENYSLPINSKASMRRFSSYEQLAPFFHQILAQEPNSPPSTRTAAPAPAALPLMTSDDSHDTGPVATPSLIKSRRGSITAALKGSFRRRKSVPTISESNFEAACSDLDAQIAKLKDQLVSKPLAIATLPIHVQLATIIAASFIHEELAKIFNNIIIM